MTPAEIMNGLAAKNRLLTQKNDEYSHLAETRAQAEKEYKIMIREQILRHKSEGHAATLIPKLVEGFKLVAEAKFKYDVAYAVERACLESIRDIRSQIDTYRSLLSWLKAELQSQ